VWLDYQSDDPSWSNWYGDDDSAQLMGDGRFSDAAAARMYSGTIIAVRVGTHPVTVVDPETWADRIHFWIRSS